jgi:uracil-DNA glycosylase
MSNSLTAHYIRDIFADIHPSWKKIFFSSAFKPIINACFSELDDDLASKGVTRRHVVKNGMHAYLRPEPANIFDAFRYFDANNLRAIVVGQDPYPSLKNACGMSFSVPRETGELSKSLNNIFAALKNSGFIERPPTHGSFTNIAEQGVLFLNRYLTRTPNIQRSDSGGIYVNGDKGKDSDCMHKFWSKFTDKLLAYLAGEFLTQRSNYGDQHITVMLWGAKAQELEKQIREATSACSTVDRVHVLKWRHPSPQSYIGVPKDHPDRFEFCDHFTRTNEILDEFGFPTIDWNPDHKCAFDTRDQFFSIRGDVMSEDPKAPLTDDEKKLIMSLLKSGRAYNDGTDTSANRYIRELLAKRKTDTHATHADRATPVPDVTPATPATPVPETPETAPTSEMPPVVMFTDGACPGNGKTNMHVRGGYAAWFPETYCGMPNGVPGAVVYGRLPERMLNMQKDRSIVEIKNPVKCTNQRAELLGAIHGIEEILRNYRESRVRRPVIIVADNEYVIRWMVEGLWKYRNEDKNLRNVQANRDLVVLLYKSLSALSKILPTRDADVGDDGDVEIEDLLLGIKARTAWKRYFVTKGKSGHPEYDPDWQGLTVLHKYSHKSAPEEGTPEWERWHGNSKADEYANTALTLPEEDMSMHRETA